jgi:hypothetical protein
MDGNYHATVADNASSDPESGSGVLERLQIAIHPSTPTGIYTLALTSGLHVGPDNGFANADTLATARIGVSPNCSHPDGDADGFSTALEQACGSGYLDSASIPERVDGVYSGVDDDKDGTTDEAPPFGASAVDCDGDGYTGAMEGHLYYPSARGDQDPCGTNASPPTNPPTAIGWPSDLIGGGIPDTTNKLTIRDVTSFIAPDRRLDTNGGEPFYNRRWDLIPGVGPAPFPKQINILDLLALFNGERGSPARPPMLGSSLAFDQTCPWPP